ncbi:cell division protein FtsQ/DivIB [Spelaeicoccus albus]|uniref:Cell division protein FtsQ n=1 Tax=Spelaeicoccus albus TaxID=1280376 RepID=A0A7Z0IIY6_9MICO|nr:FtsQ-type POTRA domain-containing protein [Spelaeicoccus albus]NYI68988.1 cell division protein FtsQ [Spelaeicoccus albus]
MKARPSTPYRKPIGERRAVSVTSLDDAASTDDKPKTQGKKAKTRGTSAKTRDTSAKTQGKKAKASRTSAPAAQREPVVSFAQWASRRRHRRRLIVGWIAALAVVVVAVAAVAYLTPVLAVDRVTVTGTSIISSGSVRKTVDEQVSGIPLPRVSDHDVAQAVLDKYPVAKSVDVGKSLPRTVTVTVTERQPVAATGSPGDYKLIDGDGVTVTTASTPPKGIPVLDIDVSTAGAGAIRAALSAMDALPEHIAKKVESVSATSSSGVEFTLRSGLKIRWGDGHNGKLKAKVLGMLMKTDARYINVSVPKEPTTK